MEQADTVSGTSEDLGGNTKSICDLVQQTERAGLCRSVDVLCVN